MLKEKIGTDVGVFFISIDSNPSDAIPNFIKKNKIDFPHFYTDKKMIISKELDIKVMPTTILINKELQEISQKGIEAFGNEADLQENAEHKYSAHRISTF